MKTDFSIFSDRDKRISKYLFDDTIREMLHKEEYKHTLSFILRTSDLDFIYEIWKPFLSLYDLFPNERYRLELYFSNKESLTLEDQWICLNYLLKYRFYKPLAEKLSNEAKFGGILKSVNEDDFLGSETGYYGLTHDELLNLANMQNTIKQIKFRRLSELESRTGLALNHLLNEIHSLCFNADDRFDKIKNYNSNNVREFLKGVGVPHFHVLQILDLFDQRNISPISHPGGRKYTSNFASESEYKRLKSHVGKSIRCILSPN